MKRCASYLKTLIQWAAFVIFAVQMIFAVQKYQQKPTVSSLGTKHLSELNKVIHVVVCKISQFDYARARSIGYDSQIEFFSGQLNTGKESTDG